MVCVRVPGHSVCLTLQSLYNLLLLLHTSMIYHEFWSTSKLRIVLILVEVSDILKNV